MLLAAVLRCHGTRPADMPWTGRTRNQTRESPWGQQVEANIVEWEVLEGHCSPTRVLQCAPECSCPCRQTFWCILQSVHLVRKVCEYTRPPGRAWDPNSLLFPRARGSAWEPGELVLCREQEGGSGGSQRLWKESSGAGRKIKGERKRQRKKASLVSEE